MRLTSDCIPRPHRTPADGITFLHRLRADRLKREFERDGALPRLLLRYAMALITQTAQTPVCNRYHSVDQQLRRWLLLCLHRLASREISMTQELIANMLDARREGITVAARKLQDAGSTHYRRGAITVLDRPGLEAQVCECCSVIRHAYDRLLADYRPDEVGSRSRSGTRVHAVPQQSEVRV